MGVPGQLPKSVQGQHTLGVHVVYATHTRTVGQGLFFGLQVLGLEFVGLKPTYGLKPLGLELGFLYWALKPNQLGLDILL